MRLLLSVLVLLSLTGSLSGQQIKELIKRLGSEDWLERKKAKEALIHIGEKAGPQLVKAMQSSDIQIRELARRIIEEIGYAPPAVRRKCESLLARLLQKDDREALEQLKNLLNSEWKFYVRAYLKFFFKGGKGPAYVSVSFGGDHVFSDEDSNVEIVIENRSETVIWVPPFWLQTVVQILAGERPYVPAFICPLTWGAFKALRLKPHQKVVIRKKVKFRQAGSVYSFSYMKLSVGKVLGGGLRPQTTRIKLSPKYLKKQFLILPPRKGRSYDFGFHHGKRWAKIRLRASLKVEGADGPQQAVLQLHVAPSKWVLADVMRGLEDALKKGNFPLHARLVAFEKGTFNLIAFDVRPRIRREKEKIVVIWQKRLKNRLTAGSLVWGYVWGDKGVWSRAHFWHPVASPMEKVTERREEPQK
ncbi:MAG: hypothetical protein DRP82_00745 [Planctomycetota bacterium]|nr:MAG: hypothetical protein DRP82_00745 [Planctomycetota bacterium]